MSTSMHEYVNFWKLSFMWILGILGTIFAMVAVILLLVHWGGNMSTENSHNARVKAENQAVAEVYNLCKKQARSGVVDEACTLVMGK